MKKLLVLIISTVHMFACSKSDNSNSNTSAPTSIEATMDGALKVGLAAESSSTSSSSLSTLDSKNSDFSLLRVESLGNSTGNSKSSKILNVDASAFFVGKTTNYLVVSGEFINIKWDDGVYSCYLISFKKNAKKGKVNCISQSRIGTFEPSIGKSNAHYSKIGIKQKGDTIYFVVNSSPTSSLFKWVDGDTAPTKIVEKPFEGLGFEDVWVDYSGNNLCVLAPAVSLNSELFNGRVYCGTESSAWIDISTLLTFPILAESFQFDNYAVTNDKKIDLSNLNVTSRVANGSNGGLPSGYANRVQVSSGGIVVRAYAGSISYFTSSGDTYTLADLNSSGLYWIDIYGLGNYAWVRGGLNINNEQDGTSLKRVDLTNQTFETTEYIPQTGLVKIESIAYDADGSLIVKGTRSDGSRGYGKIDSTGNVTPLSQHSSDTFLSLIDI